MTVFGTHKLRQEVHILVCECVCKIEDIIKCALLLNTCETMGYTYLMVYLLCETWGKIQYFFRVTAHNEMQYGASKHCHPAEIHKIFVFDYVIYVEYILADNN